jgi:hypothetical protein
MDVSELVRAEVRKRMGGDAERAIALLASTELPMLAGADRARERSRVHLAILKMADGNLARFTETLRMAAVDWRDVLVGSGLGNLDWPRVLEADGFPVP